MNRREEYDSLMKELEETPVKLDYMAARVEARMKSKRWHKWLGIPVGGIMGSLLVFTILVNSVPIFAKSCSQIPLIKELAELVDFSVSLTAAIENEYVQSIEEEQTQNGITVRVEYLVVDQKQVNIFYSLNSEVYHHMDITPDIDTQDNSRMEGYFISSGNYDRPNGELNYVTIDFMDKDVPSEFKFIMEVHDNGEHFQEAIVHEPEDNKIYDLTEGYETPIPISTFTFDLSFDPKYTAVGEKINLDKKITINGQNLIVQEVEIYPTHMRLNLEDEKDNTAYLTSMSYYIENEKGKRFEKISNGISATGKENSPMMNSYRLESTFFSNSKSLTLYITGTQWLDKDKQKVKLDLIHQTAENLPEGVTFEKAMRKENGWILTFGAVEHEEDHMYDFFGSQYYDEQGNEYEYHSWSSTTGYIDEKTEEYIEKPKMFYVEIPLVGYTKDIVYMTPNFSYYKKLEEPIVVKIK